MSWSILLALCVASYALKAVGPVLAGGRQPGPHVRRTLDLVAVPLLAALILVQTLGDGHRLVLDALRRRRSRVAAVLVARRRAVPRRASSPRRPPRARRARSPDRTLAACGCC